MVTRVRFGRFMQVSRMRNIAPASSSAMYAPLLNRIALAHRLPDKLVAQQLRTNYLESGEHSWMSGEDLQLARQ